jgi:hypothetical protein
MLVTREQQEAVLNNYVNQGKNYDECQGFIDGMEAMFNLIAQIELRKLNEKLENLNKS